MVNFMPTEDSRFLFKQVSFKWKSILWLAYNIVCVIYYCIYTDLYVWYFSSVYKRMPSVKFSSYTNIFVVQKLQVLYD